MTPLTSQLIGRFGNQMFQYAAARGRAEMEGRELRMPPWVGEHIFAGVYPTVRPDGSEERVPGYGQDQESLRYTRSQVRQWFSFKPTVESLLFNAFSPWSLKFAAHVRRGDFKGYGYPIISMDSYQKTCREHELNFNELIYVSEECPAYIPELPDYLPDFYRLMTARVLLRANSSFSWWAATLGDGDVYSPVIDGLEGGKEHDCPFVRGNWPKLSTLPNMTDLHLAP